MAQSIFSMIRFKDEDDQAPSRGLETVDEQ